MAKNISTLGLDAAKPFAIISADDVKTKLNPGKPVVEWKSPPLPYAYEQEVRFYEKQKAFLGDGMLRQVRKGRVPEERIDDAVLWILLQKLRFAKIGEQDRYGRHAVGCEAHRRLAREAAVKSIVLFKNDAVGPGGSPPAARGRFPAWAFCSGRKACRVRKYR